MKLNEKVKELARLVDIHGGRAMLVGGCVRDHIMGIESKDIDVEVYRLHPEILRQLLDRLGKVDAVGQSFQVYKLDNEIDVSIPRRERKIGKGHCGFVIEGDPDMSFEEAASRRDFTMNAILMDPITGEIIDPFGGVEDINLKRIRHIKDETFIEDSLRVLRAAQFASRFGFSININTIELCNSMNLSDLPKERILEEMKKLLLGDNPHFGFAYLYWLGINKQLFPEIDALRGVLQDPEWHPEGDVFTHTGQVIREARKLIDDLSYDEKLIVMLSALCHDFGKPATTEMIEGRWRARGHEEAGIVPTLTFLDRLGMNSEDIVNQIVAIVANHLAPAVFYKSKASNSAFRRLATKVRMDLLNLVSRADVLGRYKNGKPAFNTDAHNWFDEKIANLEIKEKGPDKLLMGRHLIELGLKPSKDFKRIIDSVYELQLDGEITTVEEAIEMASRHPLVKQ